MAANPTSSIIFFLVLTLGYFITKYYLDTPVISAIYFLTLIIVQYFINLSLTSEICHESQYGLAMTTTLFPWLLIFGTMVVFIKVFPNWLSPFSNTFGYLFTYMTGVNDFLMEILKPESKNSIVAKIYENKSLLINSITLENITDWWDNMSKQPNGILKSTAGGNTSDAFKQLEKFIKLKTNVAEFIWYTLTGVLVTSVSFNYILNSGCTQSAGEMEKLHNEYLEQEKKLAATKKTQDKNQIIYKTYE